MTKIMYSSLIMVTIIMITFILTTMISKKSKMSREKNTPFECGFSPMSSARKPFSTHFFMVAMLFLVFDIEISIMLPMFSTKLNNMQEWFISSMLVMIILIAGLMHEWKNDMLEWSN
uniref:NADH dehydrogenase subunit 3 n=1 Tax=Caliscelis shandongensis TaxID=2886254 RepID=UPI001E7F7153|nr:NADH dehydrogenase subunit 3 [Caliscelis shandongensis]YP_011014881.1 NADH dehydrogenase subunit 3 [Caliscelis rhabdocladis]UDL72116.1 NADH dehydrogenase subunit 3 [Caliscelis shandongensis]WQB38575.1 NADH dehydrogenase subunit 3 [Caliscelis rhabdocladis]